MIKINMFKAGSGDCFLVQISQEDKPPVNIMIDCGFNYKSNILPYLKTLLKEQSINRFIITHYDSDHIMGAISFFNDNGLANDPKIVKVEQVWLNTFRHLQFTKRNTEELEEGTKDQIKNYVSEIDANLNLEISEGNIGAKQAATLGKIILENGYTWNTDTNGKAVSIENLKEVNITNSIKIHLLSPNRERLENLEGEFISKLSEMGLSPNEDVIFDDAFELFNKAKGRRTITEGNISAVKKIINSKTIKIFSKGDDYTKDDSFGNGSSIAFILETGNKKLLFLADAFAEDIIDGLKKKYSDELDYPIFFDAVKISHHGSFNNNSSELFKIIDSNNFLFSTNGKHKHPDVETISCIINRDLPEQITVRNLIFNYELEHLKDFNKLELKNEFNYEIKIQVATEI